MSNSLPFVDSEKPAGRVLPADAKILVEGSVQIGTSLTLVQAPRRKRASHRFSIGLPEDGVLAKSDRRNALATPGRLPVQELTWTLHSVEGNACIENRGLTASYGIFGAPGCGKTFMLMHLLRQLMALAPDHADRRYGALIVDPKAAMITQVSTAMKAAGRSDDLVVLNPRELLNAHNGGVNIIDTGLSPAELGRVLILAAQSAGIGASEPFWFGAWRNLFTAALPLLAWIEPQVTTLTSLMDAVLIVEPTGQGGIDERRIQRMARDARGRLAELGPGDRRDMELCIGQIADLPAGAGQHRHHRDTHDIGLRWVPPVGLAGILQVRRSSPRCPAQHILRSDH